MTAHLLFQHDYERHVGFSGIEVADQIIEKEILILRMLMPVAITILMWNELLACVDADCRPHLGVICSVISILDSLGLFGHTI